MSAELYTGYIHLDGPNNGEGMLRDDWGWVIVLSCRKVMRDGRAVLEVSGRLGPVPERLRVYGVDDLGTGERLTIKPP
jgi:hypothetical protein